MTSAGATRSTRAGGGNPGPAARRPEILAPAGDPLALRAAIAAGADAVYLGMARFNARGRAERFRGVTLEACVQAAKRHGVRVYVTLNTLLHDDEIELAVELAGEAHSAGADAAIVQDVGFASVLRARLPQLAVHGSTQMTIHEPEQAARLVELLGLRRVIVARECSVDEVRRIRERIRPLGAGVEVFVHGALCFAYSGQCLMSNFAGRRSANRGICAQNCRFDFTAGPVESAPGFRPLPIFERREATQLISMKDLAAFDSVAALADAGVDSFKIEGRLKGPEYVAEVTRLYRASLDAWEARRPFASADAERAAGRVFSRGFTNGYLSGRIDPSMRGDKRSLEGEPDAIVLAANRKTGVLLLEPRPGHVIRPGQGYCYAHARYRGGFLVIAADAQRDGAFEVKARFGAEASGRSHRRGASGRRRPPPPLPRGLACHLNSDPALSSRIEKLVESVKIVVGEEPVSLRLSVSGGPGELLRVRAIAGDGRIVEASTRATLEPARSRPLDAALLEEHLGRFGGTLYRLESLDASGLAPGVFTSFPLLHQVRSEIVRQLDSLQRPAEPVRPPRRLTASGPTPAPPVKLTSLCVCVGSEEAADAARRSGADRVVLESWTPAQRTAAGETWIRLPPITHDSSACASLPLDARVSVVAGNFGQIAAAKRLGLAVAADVYLNASNSLTLDALLDAGAGRATLSLEVDAKEAAAVAARAPAGLEVEVVAGGRVFSMLTRQGFGVGAGERFNAVSEHGHAYAFEAADGVTTLYEARELVGAAALKTLAGRVDAVRLDLAHQGADAVAEIVSAYRRCLDALRSAGGDADAIVRSTQAVHERHAPHGTFTGHLIRGARAQDST